MSIVRTRRKDHRTVTSDFDSSSFLESINVLKDEVSSLKKELEELKLKKGEPGPKGEKGEPGKRGVKGDSPFPVKIDLDKLEDGMGFVWSSKKKAFVAQKIFEEE